MGGLLHHRTAYAIVIHHHTPDLFLLKSGNIHVQGLLFILTTSCVLHRPDLLFHVRNFAQTLLEAMSAAMEDVVLPSNYRDFGVAEKKVTLTTMLLAVVLCFSVSFGKSL